MVLFASVNVNVPQKKTPKQYKICLRSEEQQIKAKTREAAETTGKDTLTLRLTEVRDVCLEFYSKSVNQTNRFDTPYG